MAKIATDQLSEALNRLAAAEDKLADAWAKYFSEKDRMRRKMVKSKTRLRKLRGIEATQFDRIETLLTQLVKALSEIFSEGSQVHKDSCRSSPR
jgi:hypothetical protein